MNNQQYSIKDAWFETEQGGLLARCWRPLNYSNGLDRRQVTKRNK